MRFDGSFTLPIPAAQAFRLFTAVGERDWVEGWEPVFPAPVTDDAEVGTVFCTDHGGRPVTWIVGARYLGTMQSWQTAIMRA